MIALALVAIALAALAAWSGLRAWEQRADDFEAHSERLRAIRDGR